MDTSLHLVVRVAATQMKKRGGMGQEDHLSVFVVNAEGDGGRVQEQPRLLLVHLLPQTLHATLTFGCFLQTHTDKQRDKESNLLLKPSQ